MWAPALDEQIDPYQQESLIEEITIMSLYGDTQFIQAETAYRFEQGRTSPWLAGRAKSIRHRMPMRRTPAEVIVPRHRHAA